MSTAIQDGQNVTKVPKTMPFISMAVSDVDSNYKALQVSLTKAYNENPEQECPYSAS